MLHTTDIEWGAQDSQVSTNGHGPSQPAISALVPKSEEWFALEVAMHHPDFPRADYQHTLHLFREFATGFAALAAIPASVVLWGSARLQARGSFLSRGGRDVSPAGTGGLWHHHRWRARHYGSGE